MNAIFRFFIVGISMSVIISCSAFQEAEVCEHKFGLCEERLEKTEDGRSVFRGSINRPVASKDGVINLPYMRYTTGEHKPLVYFLSGGPGLSNLKFVPPHSLTRHYDVVVLEYRGVGSSSIELESKYFQRLLLKFKGDLSLSSTDVLRPLYRKAFEDLVAQGIVFNDFTTDALISDLEALRSELGYRKVHLVAHSYGTRVALKYRSLHPEAVGNSALFALNTPGGFIWSPDETNAVLSRYQKSLEAAGSSYSAPFKEMLENPNQWHSRWFGMKADSGRALFAAFMLSYNRHTASFAYDAMLTAHKGRSFSWFSLGKSFGIFIRMGFNYADLLVKAYVEDCNAEAILKADAQGKNAVFQSPSSLLFAGYREFEEVSGNCQSSEFEPDFTNTMVVSGSMDPSTPLESLPSNLPPEQHIILQNFGHADALYRDKELAGRAISNYLLSKKIDEHAFGHVGVLEPKGWTR